MPFLLAILLSASQLPQTPGTLLMNEGARCAATGFCPLPPAATAQGPLFLVTGAFLLLLAGWRKHGSSR